MCVSVFMCLSVGASTVERESPPPRLSLSIGARQTSDDDGDRHRHTRGISGKEDGGGGGGGAHGRARELEAVGGSAALPFASSRCHDESTGLVSHLNFCFGYLFVNFFIVPTN